MTNKNLLGGKRGKELCDLASQYGFHLKRANRHAIWCNSKGAVVVTAATPSDTRALKNCERMFRLQSATA